MAHDCAIPGLSSELRCSRGGDELQTAAMDVHFVATAMQDATQADASWDACRIGSDLCIDAWRCLGFDANPSFRLVWTRT
mmetsp:Transcript_38068/g.104777  ORF Transcript_38068/g.104777 Transcript_38068/m.104777 type:complete len:80 (+) Transcript_38068:46-285(+)